MVVTQSGGELEHFVPTTTNTTCLCAHGEYRLISKPQKRYSQVLLPIARALVQPLDLVYYSGGCCVSALILRSRNPFVNHRQ